MTRALGFAPAIKGCSSQTSDLGGRRTKRTGTPLGTSRQHQRSADFSRLRVNNAPGFPAWTNDESKPTEVGAPVMRDLAVVVLTRCTPRGLQAALEVV